MQKIELLLDSRIFLEFLPANFFVLFSKSTCIMLASKSIMFAKNLMSRPAVSQRFMSAAADLKVTGGQEKPVCVCLICFVF